MEPLTAIDKNVLLEQLRSHLADDLSRIESSQSDAVAAATHEESRAEGDKDMRSTELSYLARGLAQRVADLREALERLRLLRVRSFLDDSPIALTALVRTEDEEGQVGLYFVAPAGGGMKLEHRGQRISVITREAPIGAALLGKRVGDELEVAGRQGRRALEIIEVA